MKKRWITAVLALILVMSVAFVACDKENNEDTSAATTAATTAEATTVATTVATTTAEAPDSPDAPKQICAACGQIAKDDEVRCHVCEHTLIDPKDLPLA